MIAKQFKSLKKGDIVIGQVKAQPMFYEKECIFDSVVENDPRYMIIITPDGRKWQNTYKDFKIKQ